MRILFLCTYYHRAMIFRDSMDSLKKLGHSVKAFNAVNKDAKIDAKYKKIMDEAVIHKECFNKWDRFFYFQKQKKFYNELIKSCDINDYDLIHSHNLFNGGFAARKVYKKYGIPYFVSVRSTDVNIFLKIPFFKYLANIIVKDASGVQFLSTPYRNNFIEKCVHKKFKKAIYEKSIVLTNGLEEFWLKNNLKTENTIHSSEVKLLCVGKIDKNKNMQTVLKVIERLNQKGYKATLTVVGQTVDDSVYDELKKSSYVKIYSYMTKEDLIKVYRAHDIFIMPSIHETFGRVYAEAMTQGLPVIYSKGQGFDGIFTDGVVGYATPSRDYEYMVKCIENIICNYQDISRNCLKESTRFDWNLITDQLASFYSTAIKGEI